MKKRRTWIFVILILVVIAVVLAIVFINLFKERNTKALSEKVNECVTTGYLSPGEQNDLIDKWLLGLTENEDAQLLGEKNKLENFKSAFEAYEVIGQFFNKHLIFVEATDDYSKNRKGIESALDDSQSRMNEIEIYLKENADKTSGSDYWSAATWVDLKQKQNMTDVINFTANAFTALAEVYNSSMPKTQNDGIINNQFSALVLNTMSTLLVEISTKPDERANAGEELLNFVTNYLGNEQIMFEYPYRTKTFKDRIADIAEHGKESEFYQYFFEANLDALAREGV